MQMIAGSVSHRVELSGLGFHYLEWGDASSPPLVLLHGGRGNAHGWDFVAPRLAERYHLLAPDQRGHGDTGHAASYSTQDDVDDLEALRQHWGIERFVLMGQSLGGHNAMAYASQHRNRVSHLIILDVPPVLEGFHRPQRRAQAEELAQRGHRRFATLDEAIAASFAEARGRNSTAPDERLRYRIMCNVRELPDGAMVVKWDPKMGVLRQVDDLWPVVGSITMPSLLVRGGLTNVLPRPTAERMVAEFPHLELVEIPDASHWIPWDRPEELGRIVVEWLSRNG